MHTVRNPWLIGILIMSLVIGSSTLTRGHEWGDDFASYIMQAQSILNGRMPEFVERNTFTIFESSFQIGPVAYPWGYPLILTPALLLKGVHALTLKIPGLLFFISFLICLYQLTETRLARTESLLLVSLFAFNPTLLKFLDQILSDIPFLFFIFLGLIWITRFKPGPSPWNHVLLGVILFFAFFIRTTGIILLASFLAYQALRFFRERADRKNIAVNSAIVVAVYLLLMIITTLIFPNGQGSYLRQLMGLTLDIFLHRNIPGYFTLFLFFFANTPGPGWMYVYYFLIVFFLIGVWTRRSTDQALLLFFGFFYMAMLLWPEWQGVRFIFPLLPLFIYFAFQGMQAITHQLPDEFRRLTQGLFQVFWVILIGIFLLDSGTRAYENLMDNRKINGPFDPYSSDVYNYIRTETPPESVIVFYKPRAMRLFTDHDTLMSTECNRLTLGDYVVISKKAENSQIPPGEIDQCGLTLQNVFENQRFIIYELPR